MCPPAADRATLERLNAVPKGPRRIFQPTVARPDGKGRWWLMNRPTDGWNSFGYPHASLESLATAWALEFIAVGEDEVSAFVSVRPV